MSYGWIQAMDEALVTAHIGVADKSDSYDTAKRKLEELIDWHVAVATDSRVNGGWQLVPSRVTPEWRAAMQERGVRTGSIRHMVEDALAAAPSPDGRNA